jgi:hypothetical protein
MALRLRGACSVATTGPRRCGSAAPQLIAIGELEYWSGCVVRMTRRSG